MSWIDGAELKSPGEGMVDKVDVGAETAVQHIPSTRSCLGRYENDSVQIRGSPKLLYRVVRIRAGSMERQNQRARLRNTTLRNVKQSITTLRETEGL